MRRPDPLATLLRLRAVEERVARSRFAEGVARQAAAEAERADHAARLAAEGRAGAPDALAAWLPRARAEGERRLRDAARAGADAEAARDALAAARAATRLAEQAVARRAAQARREALEREARALDDWRAP